VVPFHKSLSSVQLMCSLDITIPSNVIVIWTHNSNVPSPNSRQTQNGNTATLLIENPQPSDAGQYSCTFIGLNLQRYINLG